MEGIDIDSIVRRAVTEYRRQERQEVASTACAGEALALDIDTRRKLVYAKAKVELATLEVQDLEAELADEARAEARQVEDVALLLERLRGEKP